MPTFEAVKLSLEKFKLERAEAEQAVRHAAAAVRLAEEEAKVELRTTSHPRPQASAILLALRTAEQAAAKALQVADSALAEAIEAFEAVSDPRSALSQLPDSDPFLLFPLRLETRFKTVGVNGQPQHELWVRIYPDVCLIDSFEAPLSQSELASAKVYWIEQWRANGHDDLQRSAWRGLVAAHGTGRARWIVKTFMPINPNEKPNSTDGAVVLIVASSKPLLPSEIVVVARYWQQIWLAGNDRDKKDAAQIILQAQLGVNRAADILLHYAPDNLADRPRVSPPPINPVRVAFLSFPSDPEVRATSWSAAPLADPMPERFVLVLQGSLRGRREVLGKAIRQPLYTGFDPSGVTGGMPSAKGATLDFPETARWMADFDAAVQAGMGFRVVLDALEAANGFSRLYVIGLSVGDSAEEGKKRLQQFIHHRLHSAAGFEIVPQGTPTNNTEERDAGFTYHEDPERVYNAMLGDGLFVDTSDAKRKSDGQWLAEVLGQKTEMFKRVLNADRLDQAHAQAMSCAIWPATIGYFMSSLLSPAFDRTTINATRDYFIDHVSGRGLVTAIRIGRQPYGILPVTAMPRAAWLGTDHHPRRDAFLASLMVRLDKMEQRWSAFALEVAHIGATDDAQKTLLNILGLHPASAEFYYRYSQSTTQTANFLRLVQVPWESSEEAKALKADILAFLREMGYTELEVPQIARLLFHGGQGILDGGVVSSDPPHENFATEHQRYIGWLRKAATGSVEMLRLQQNMPDGNPPRALLFILLRHALLLGYSEAAVEAHRRIPGFTEVQIQAMLRDEPLPHVRLKGRSNQNSESRWEALYKTDRRISEDTDISIADYLTSKLGKIKETVQLAEQIDALGILRKSTREEVDRAFREHIDCCGYRLDAWQLGIPRVQLDRMERKGIYLGAYGWLHDVKPLSRPLVPAGRSTDEEKLLDPAGKLPPLMQDRENGGLIHGPSMNHAMTGALLRNAYMTADTPAEKQAIGVNLSSERVRDALYLADGMRKGQRLNALLGYRFERGLHEGHQGVETDQFMAAFRNALPLTTGGLTETVATPEDEGKVEARNVVDGLKLVEQMRKPGNDKYPFGLTLNVVPAPDLQQLAVINSEAANLVNLHDALGDLVLAESVHQSVQGNFDRVAASLDAFAKGEAPPEAEIVRTPSSGIAITHRVAIHLDANAVVGATPRSIAEPAVNAWLDATLPALANIGCTVNWIVRATSAVGTTTVTLADIGLTPIDLVYSWQAGEADHFAHLDDLVVEFAIAGNPTLRTDASITIEYMQAPPNALSIFETAALVRSLAAIVQSSRVLRPSDLMLESEATLRAEETYVVDASGLQACVTQISGLKLLMFALIGDIDSALLDTMTNHQATVDRVDTLLARACALQVQAGTFGITQSRPGSFRDAARRVFDDMTTCVSKLVTDWEKRLARCDTELTKLPGANDEMSVAILRRAEIEIPSLQLANGTNVTMLESEVRAKRSDFFQKIETYRALLRTSNPSLGMFIGEFETLLGDPLFYAGEILTKKFRDDIGVLVADLRSGIATTQEMVSQRLSHTTAKLATLEIETNPHQQAEILMAAAQALFGEGFRLVPGFTLKTGPLAEFNRALSAARSGATMDYLINTLKVRFPVDEWLHGIARVREPMRYIESTVMLTEGFGRRTPELTPLQFPFKDGDHWLGLEFPKTYDIDRSRLLYSAHLAAGAEDGGGFRGILVDEWTEVIPGIRRESGVQEKDVHTQSSGVAFHFDRPNAEAPQSFLLVTPATWDGRWHWEDIVGALDWTWEKMKQRAVEPDLIKDPVLSHLLPTTVAAAAVRDITISAVLATNIGVAKFMKE